MISSTLQNEIEEAIPGLLELAREVTWNKISGHCKFIVSEIKNSEGNFHEQRRKRKKENDLKIPLTLQELMPALQQLYENFYDINLYIYRVTKNLTIIDIRYYPKSSLELEYRQQVANNKPMLHCKVTIPAWVSDKKNKFDINWEHKEWLIHWKLYWERQKLKRQKR
ncbi:hypothetical protein [Ferruginibacter sp. SUN106]|uniref:hypothetical protein n=1 Tax=Ferruginibacter sp. SUN106 TaxID=2978348 RepID=UPI003D3675F4